MKAGTSMKEWQNITYFGDDPRDRFWIQKGIDIYNERHETYLEKIKKQISSWF